jgi:hypothetical protein
MLMAILLGTWVLVSILVTPLIGYLLYAVRRPRHLSNRSATPKRHRSPAWNYLASRRPEYPRHTAGLSKSHRHEARGPRAG